MIENLHMLNEIGWLVIVTVIILIFTIANQTFDLVSKFCSNFGIKTVRSIERENATKNINILLEQMEELKRTREEDVKQSIRHDEQLKKSVEEISKRLADMESEQKATKVEELKDRLTQSYRHYKSVAERDNQKVWNELEADAFWGLFERYTSYGGNHYVKDVIEPYMREFKVISISKDYRGGIQDED